MPRLTHAIKRPNGDIARELALCQPCHDAIGLGADPAELARKFRQVEPATVDPEPQAEAEHAPLRRTAV